MTIEDEKVAAEKAAADRQAERDKIKVTTPVPVVEDKEEVETKEEGEEESEVETKEEEKEEVETKDEKEEEAEAEDVEKLKRTITRLQKRLDKETGSKKDLNKELAAARTALEAKQAEGEVILTEEEVERRSEEKAARKVAEKEFVATCNRLFDDAVKIDKQFKNKVDAMAEDIGAIPSMMIGILGDIDNGAAVLSYLTNNVEEAEEIYTKSAPKMAIELAKLSTKLTTKKPTKELSKVPAPNDPVSGSANPKFDPYNTKSTDDKDWIEKRNRQVAERRANKLAGMR